MNIIAVDDEANSLCCLEENIRIAESNCDVKTFSNPTEALNYASKFPVAVAFLDIEMRGMTGIELAVKLKDINAKTNIIFVTGYSNYASNAIKLRASGYLLKPASVKDIQDELNNLRFPLTMGKLFVRCFGAFDVFYQGKPLFFPRAKSKELLAYLIDRKGSHCKYF